MSCHMLVLVATGSFHISTDRCDGGIGFSPLGLNNKFPRILPLETVSSTCALSYSHLTVKLARSPQVDDQTLQANTGTLSFAEPADQEGDKFQPCALK